MRIQNIYVKNLVRARTCETPIISDDPGNKFFFIKIFLKFISRIILSYS